MSVGKEGDSMTGRSAERDRGVTRSRYESGRESYPEYGRRSARDIDHDRSRRRTGVRPYERDMGRQELSEDYPRMYGDYWDDHVRPRYSDNQYSRLQTPTGHYWRKGGPEGEIYEDRDWGENRLDPRDDERYSGRGYGQERRSGSQFMQGEMDYRRGYEEWSRGNTERSDEPYRSEPRHERRGGWWGRGSRYSSDDLRERAQVRCRDVMTRDVTVCAPETPIRDVADMMKDEDVGSIPVVERGRLFGIVTDRDVVCRIIATDINSRTATAGQACSEELVTCSPDDPITEALRRMGENQVRRLPIVDSIGRLVGIVSLADVALEAEADPELERAIEFLSVHTPTRSRSV